MSGHLPVAPASSNELNGVHADAGKMRILGICHVHSLDVPGCFQGIEPLRGLDNQPLEVEKAEKKLGTYHTRLKSGLVGIIYESGSSCVGFSESVYREEIKLFHANRSQGIYLTFNETDLMKATVGIDSEKIDITPAQFEQITKLRAKIIDLLLDFFLRQH